MAAKFRRTALIQYNTRNNYTRTFNQESTGERVFKAPQRFSFIENTDETIGFFGKLISFMSNASNDGKTIFIDVSKVKVLTIDALMYLLAIVNNAQKRWNVVGNTPNNSRVRRLFIGSGFFQFVRHQDEEPITASRDTIKIVSGENSSTTLAKQVSDFICSKACVEKRTCGFLYNMMIELMSNTHKHAYNNDAGLFYSRWYCFVEFDRENTLSFIFMDTGEGIPATVRKSFPERLDLLKLKDESKYVVSALKGEFRTSTKQANRGKGLPKIREFCSSRRIQNVRIITNKADVTVHESEYFSNDLEKPLRGTLYYWQVNINALKGEI